MYAYVHTVMCTCKFSGQLVQVGSFHYVCPGDPVRIIRVGGPSCPESLILCL